MTEYARLPVYDDSDPIEQLKALRKYVVRLDRALSEISGNVSEADLSPSLKRRVIDSTEQSIDKLRSEIIETAREIRQTGERIELELINGYVAKGDIGTYTEDALQCISLDGKGVTQYFEEITSISERMDEAEAKLLESSELIGENAASVQKINAYVRTGKLDDGVYGIEIGNFSGGESAPYKVRLSENRLSFYVGGDEAAYFSDNSMYISRARVPITLSVGSCTLRNDRGLTFTAEG